MGWLKDSSDARYKWEQRIATMVGFVLLICLMPVVDAMAKNGLMGLLVIAIFILVYGFVAGRLLAVLDRHRMPRAQASD